MKFKKRNPDTKDLDKFITYIYQISTKEAERKNKIFNENSNKILTGDLYEDVVRKVIKAILKIKPNLEMKIVSGHIYKKDSSDNKKMNQSKQIDIILTFKKAKVVKIGPFKKGVFLDDVVAAIEVKKSINQPKIFNEAILNIQDVSKLVDFQKVNPSKFKDSKCCSLFKNFQEEIANEMETEKNKFTTVIFGFKGYDKEETLRDAFRELLKGERIGPKKKENIKIGHLYELPDLFLDNKNAILKTNSIFQLFGDGRISYFATCNNLDQNQKLFFFKMYILEAIAKKMNNDDLYNDIGQVLKAIPFTANEILGFNLNNASKYLCNNNKLRKTKWDIKEKIELLEKEKVVMMNVHNGFQIKNNDENVISLIKQNILIDNNGRISGNPNVFISLIGDKMIAFFKEHDD